MGETEQVVSEGAIELHPEVVRQRQDTYSSLTDLHGVDVFSDDFQNSVEQVGQQIEEAERQLEESIFVEEIIVTADTDEQLLMRLFDKQEEVVLAQNYTTGNTKWTATDVGLVLIGVLAVAALYLFLFSDKKTRRNRT